MPGNGPDEALYLKKRTIKGEQMRRNWEPGNEWGLRVAGHGVEPFFNREKGGGVRERPPS